MRDFTADLVQGVSTHRAAIDARIVTALADGWSLQRLPRVDRTIMRIAVYEIDHTAVPDAVAVSEAVGLVAQLSTDDSPKFVNGVLRTVVETKTHAESPAVGRHRLTLPPRRPTTMRPPRWGGRIESSGGGGQRQPAPTGSSSSRRRCDADPDRARRRCASLRCPPQLAGAALRLMVLRSGTSLISSHRDQGHQRRARADQEDQAGGVAVRAADDLQRPEPAGWTGRGWPGPSRRR